MSNVHLKSISEQWSFCNCNMIWPTIYWGHYRQTLLSFRAVSYYCLSWSADTCRTPLHCIHWYLPLLHDLDWSEFQHQQEPINRQLYSGFDEGNMDIRWVGTVYDNRSVGKIIRHWVEKSWECLWMDGCEIMLRASIVTGLRDLLQNTSRACSMICKHCHNTNMADSLNQRF